MDQIVTLQKERTLLGRGSIIGGFIAAHGAMHTLLLSTPRLDGGAGNFVTRGGDIQLLSSLGLGGGTIELLGAALMLLTTAGLVISAHMYLRQRQGWEGWLLVPSAISIATLLLFWNYWMLLGPIIDLGLMALALRSIVEVARA